MPERVDYQLEPELNSPKPRPIEPRTGAPARVLVGCLWIFMLPFLIIGIVVPLFALHCTATAAFGKTISGQVLERFYQSDEDSGGYKIRYSYQFGGREYVRQDDDHSGGALTAGAEAPVRIAPWAPGIGAALLSDRTWPWKWSLLMWCFSLFWDAIVSVFAYAIFVSPMIVRSLYRNGDIAVATIKDKSVTSGESTSYKLTYEFYPNAIGPSQQSIYAGSKTVTELDYNTVATGDRLTVLYNPRNPKRSVLYRFGGYQIAKS